MYLAMRPLAWAEGLRRTHAGLCYKFIGVAGLGSLWACVAENCAVDAGRARSTPYEPRISSAIICVAWMQAERWVFLHDGPLQRSSVFREARWAPMSSYDSTQNQNVTAQRSPSAARPAWAGAACDTTPGRCSIMVESSVSALVYRQHRDHGVKRGDVVVCISLCDTCGNAVLQQK